MSGQAFVGTFKRTFREALFNLLKNGYGLIGSRRVLRLLADDVQQLVDEFYPPAERLRSGWMVFTGTKASGTKAYPGQSASDHELVTLAWPVLLSEDIRDLTTWPQGEARVKARREWLQKRLVRLIEYGWHHQKGPVLLTQADLAAMLGLTTVDVSKLLKQARAVTGKQLMTKGYYFDQGMRPTHKAEIITLYEAGRDESEIARLTQHAQASVGRYIRDYERVKALLAYGTSVEEIRVILEMQPGVVQAYVALVEQYHLELVSEPLST
jgi:predicted transcriptional regulator